MKLIAALGNPGLQYNFTRHNLGFLSLDLYAKQHSLTWVSDTKFQAHVITLDAPQKAILVKPQTYYNNVGESIQKIIHYYKIDPSRDLLVICDDFDLPLGTIRLREQGTPAGNNGLKSITTHLSTQAFHRLRLGTNNPEVRQTLGDIDFVLSKFTPEERDQLPQILAQVSQKIDEFLQK